MTSNNPRTTARLTNAAGQLECRESELHAVQINIMARMVLTPECIPEVYEKLKQQQPFDAAHQKLLECIIEAAATGEDTVYRLVCAVVKEAQRGRK